MSLLRSIRTSVEGLARFRQLADATTSLPAAVGALGDADVLEVLRLAASLANDAERLRAVAAGGRGGPLRSRARPRRLLLRTRAPLARRLGAVDYGR